MSVDYKLIGGRIKHKRTAVKLTQENMAEELQVSVGYVSQIERGIAKPNLEMLSAISDILNCDISDFVSNVNTVRGNFLNSELNDILAVMNSSQKQMLFEIAKIIKSHNVKK